MKKRNIRAFIAPMAIVALVISCSDDYFDQGRYEELIENSFPVENVDTLHSWNLIRKITATVDLSSLPESEYVVNVYDTNPSNPTARKITTASIQGKDIIKFSLPKGNVVTQLYVIAVGGGKCVVDGYFDIVGDGVNIVPNVSYDADFSLFPATSPVEYTYCFEESFPQGGDFDFNDCVMGVSLEKSPKALNGKGNFLDITVRLRAVGGTKNIASSLRLVGINSALVVDTFVITRKGWDFFKYSVDYLEDPEGKLKPTNIGDLRIDLFNDAHFAINGGSLDETGTMVPHVYINTKNGQGDELAYDYLTLEPKESTYRVEFKDDFHFNDFSFSDIDLFIITAYNASFCETHIPKYFGLRVLKDYLYNIDYIPWALLIPDVFRYPIEGKSIGMSWVGYNYYDGAYQNGQHSFGAWASDRNNVTAQDWYLYPYQPLVYPAN
ncbi:MAG: LruC domain-containing protein [Prevotella sp.]